METRSGPERSICINYLSTQLWMRLLLRFRPALRAFSCYLRLISQILTYSDRRWTGDEVIQKAATSLCNRASNCGTDGLHLQLLWSRSQSAPIRLLSPDHPGKSHRAVAILHFKAGTAAPRLG